MSSTSRGVSDYYVTFIGEYSGYVVVISISRKSDALQVIMKLHKCFERRYDCRIKYLSATVEGSISRAISPTTFMNMTLNETTIRPIASN